MAVQSLRYDPNQIEQLRTASNVLGYDKWENFAKVIEKAVTACKNAGFEPSDHFLEARKMIGLGKGGQREIDERVAGLYGLAGRVCDQKGLTYRRGVRWCENPFSHPHRPVPMYIGIPARSRGKMGMKCPLLRLVTIPAGF